MKERRNTGMSRGAGRFAKVAAAALLCACSAALAQNISTSKHNLSSTGPGNKFSGGEGEVCVFCHTPHGGSNNGAPLWNKATPTGAAYTLYSSTTMDAAFATDGTSGGTGGANAIGSVSIACLSCHDGSQAMDSVINAPGSGGYNTAGARMTGTWTGTTVDTTTGRLLAPTATSGVANLTQDLSNDHPIGIQYCGGGVTTTSATGPCTDPDFAAPKNASLASGTVWWVDTTGGTADKREKTDMILYTRAFGANSGPSVECASCHDPHNNTNNTFLRIANTGSAVCLTCHNK